MARPFGNHVFKIWPRYARTQQSSRIYPWFFIPDLLLLYCLFPLRRKMEIWQVFGAFHYRIFTLWNVLGRAQVFEIKVSQSWIIIKFKSL